MYVDFFSDADWLILLIFTDSADFFLILLIFADFALIFPDFR